MRPDGVPDGARRWSRLAWRELRALELRDEERRQAEEADEVNGNSCCRFWRGVPYIGGGPRAHGVLYCPACGERLRGDG